MHNAFILQPMPTYNKKKKMKKSDFFSHYLINVEAIKMDIKIKDKHWMQD